MKATNQFKLLRGVVVLVLSLLGIQYELGMVVNLSPSLPTSPPFAFSFAAVVGALRAAGSAALAHALLGSFLTLFAVGALALSLASRVRSVQVFGSLGFLSLSLASLGGVLFVLSGFQADHYSIAMASNFLLGFTFYFLELYCLRPASNARAN